MAVVQVRLHAEKNNAGHGGGGGGRRDYRAAELRGFGAAQKARSDRVWGAAHDAVLARIDAPRRAQVGRKRAAEGREDDDDARAQARQRVGGGGGEDGDTIL